MAAAVSGAHLTGTADASRPSVFEILSHEGFASALKPAVSHVIKVLAERDPGGKFGGIYRYFDELYLCFDAVIQWHYILTRGATLSEAFYGLERKLTTANRKLLRVRLSYLMSVLVPYISSKLEKLYKQAMNNESIGAENSLLNVSESKSGSILWISKYFILIYPYVRVLLKTINLLYLLSYTFGYSDHHNLTFRLIKMTLGYTSEERSKFMEAKNLELFMLSEWKNWKNLPKLVFRSLGESALWAVEIGTFFIQFLDWWHHDEQRARINVSSLPIPPAPQARPQKVQNFVTLLPSDINKCPLCRDDFRNPTAISVSGIVCCYSCIFPYLEKHGRCPLTNLVCNNNHLIRVYR